MPLRKDYASAIGALAKALSEQLEKQKREKESAEPQQLETSAPTADESVLHDLIAASDYLCDARRDIQRNIRTPISPDDTSELTTLLTSIYDLLTLKEISDKLQQQQQRTVSKSALADIGCTILDKANDYSLLANHFFDPRVETARIERPSDAVKAEVAAVSGEAASLKASVITYLQNVENALRLVDLGE